MSYLSALCGGVCGGVWICMLVSCVCVCTHDSLHIAVVNPNRAGCVCAVFAGVFNDGLYV